MSTGFGQSDDFSFVGEPGVISYMENFLQFIFVILFAKNYVYAAKGDKTHCLWHFQVAALAFLGMDNSWYCYKPEVCYP